MSNGGNNKTKAKSIINSLVAPVVTALVVGGTAPWWVGLIQGDKTVNVQGSSISETVSREPEEPKIINDDISTDIKESEVIASDDPTIASDNATVASDQATVQQSYGSGPNIAAGRDVNYNEAPESLDTVQDSGILILNSEGISYEEARTALIDSGWQPLTPVSMGGLPDTSDPVIDYIFNKKGYQEVKACSGTGLGLCLFKFSNGRGKEISVSTVNNQPGDVITVYGWREETP